MRCIHEPCRSTLRGQRAAIRSAKPAPTGAPDTHLLDLRKRQPRRPNNHDGVIAADAIRHGYTVGARAVPASITLRSHLEIVY
jgi:hypothetical protein